MIPLPSDEILLKYVSGAIDPALRMLVDRHIELHPQTRDSLRDFEEFGGHLLAEEADAGLTAGSLDRALARLAASPQQINPLRASFPALDALRWRWAGPGRAIANIEIAGSRLKTYALRIAPGSRDRIATTAASMMPAHLLKRMRKPIIAPSQRAMTSASVLR